MTTGSKPETGSSGATEPLMGSAGYHRQRHRRWMLAVMQDGLGRALRRCIRPERCAGVGIRCELRIVAAGDLQADAIARSEFVTRWPNLDLILVRPTRRDRCRVRQRVPE